MLYHNFNPAELQLQLHSQEIALAVAIAFNAWRHEEQMLSMPQPLQTKMTHDTEIWVTNGRLENIY